MKLKPPIFLALAFLGWASPSSAVTLVNDTYADGDRTTQNLPSSMAWLSGSGTTNLPTTTGMMTWTTAGSGRTIIAYYGTNAAGTTPATLAVGDVLTASFNFTITGTAGSQANGLRIGLLNSSTSTGTPTRVTADNFANSNAAFAGYTGYAAFLNPAGGASTLSLRERTNTTSTALLSTATDYTQVTGSASATAPGFVAGTAYTGTFTLSRTAADQLSLTFTLSSGATTLATATASDTGITSVFDTISFSSSSTANIDYNFTSFSITQVPEPGVASWVALCGVAGGVVCLRRRQRQPA